LKGAGKKLEQKRCHGVQGTAAQSYEILVDVVPEKVLVFVFQGAAVVADEIVERFPRPSSRSSES